MKERVPELDEYVDLMRKRALGQAPEMDCAKQAATIVRDRLRSSCLERLSVIDVGCATGHYLRSLRKAFPHADLDYVGIDIDPKMIASAKQVWSDCSDSRISTRFVCSGIDELRPENLESLSLAPADVVLCSNAFMYFSVPQRALANLMGLSKRLLVIRSYFCDLTLKVLRAQPREVHVGSSIDECEILDDNGFPRFYDEWNYYSYTYMEANVKKIDPGARVSWVDESGSTASMELEQRENISKRDPTRMLGGIQVVPPFMLTWRYLLVEF